MANCGACWTKEFWRTCDAGSAIGTYIYLPLPILIQYRVKFTYLATSHRTLRSHFRNHSTSHCQDVLAQDLHHHRYRHPHRTALHLSSDLQHDSSNHRRCREQYHCRTLHRGLHPELERFWGMSQLAPAILTKGTFTDRFDSGHLGLTTSFRQLLRMCRNTNQLQQPLVSPPANPQVHETVP